MNRLLIDIPETIDTPHLTLQMPRAGWGEKLHAAMMDGYEDYVRWLAWSPTPPSPEALEEECRKHQADFIMRDFIRYLMVEKQTQEVVGRCGFPSFQANWAIPQFGISYFVRASKRAKGYATQAAHALSLMAFQTMGARKLEIYCDAENVASSRVPLKLNFTLEYTQRGGWPRPDNTLATLQTYSLFSEKDLVKLSF